MDDRGYWHNRPSIGDQMKEACDRERNSDLSNDRPRFEIELEVGSTVELTVGNENMLAIFEGAEKNKVMLRPIEQEGKQMPYLETAATVILSDGTHPGVKAQVWDNRRGKIVLRTLPVGGWPLV